MGTSKQQPRLTVLLSVYNSERYLAEAIDSVLSQTFSDFEFLIINDGSTDRSCNIIQTYTDPRIRLVHNTENIGLTKSLNRGLALARGALIARQDADDRSLPRRLQYQVEFMDSNPGVALLGTQCRIICAAGRVLRSIGEYRVTSPLAIQWALLFGNPFVHSSVIFRKNVIVEELGGYNERYQFNQDFELWSRLLEKHSASNLPVALVDYRSHENSIAGRRNPDWAAVMRENLKLNIGVQRKNIYRVLHSEKLGACWPEIWSAITVSWLSKRCERKPTVVLKLVREIHTAFLQLHPDGKNDLEIRKHLAEKLCYIACCLHRECRISSIRAYLWAIRTDPAIALRESPRFWMLYIFGPSAISFSKRLSNALRDTVSIWQSNSF